MVQGAGLVGGGGPVIGASAHSGTQWVGDPRSEGTQRVGDPRSEGKGPPFSSTNCVATTMDLVKGQIK